MSYYVRVVDGSWLSKDELTSAIEYPWILQKGDDSIPSDFIKALGDIRRCEMSLFYVDDLSQIALIIASKKATVEMNKDFYHAVFFDESQINDLGLVIKETKGTTPDNDVNNLHRDIQNLTVDEVHSLIDLFYENDRQTFASAEILTIINQKVENNEWKKRVHPDYKAAS